MVTALSTESPHGTPDTLASCDFTRGHTDINTLPLWVFEEWPPSLWGYSAAAYIVGVQVGIAAARVGEHPTATEEGQ